MPGACLRLYIVLSTPEFWIQIFTLSNNSRGINLSPLNQMSRKNTVFISFLWCLHLFCPQSSHLSSLCSSLSLYNTTERPETTSSWSLVRIGRATFTYYPSDVLTPSIGARDKSFSVNRDVNRLVTEDDLVIHALTTIPTRTGAYTRARTHTHTEDHKQTSKHTYASVTCLSLTAWLVDEVKISNFLGRR